MIEFEENHFEHSDVREYKLDNIPIDRTIIKHPGSEEGSEVSIVLEGEKRAEEDVRKEKKIKRK